MSAGYMGIDVWQARTEYVRSLLGERLGVQPQRILFVGSTTEALNLTARSIVWRSGDRIVVPADEFPSVAYPWAHASHAGARLVEIPIPSESDREARVLDAIGPGTRAVAVSHVHSRTGTVLDIERVGQACQAAGALLVVDGIQAVGAIPVTIGEEVDVYCAATFKWLIAGFGLAVLVVSDRALAAMEPAYRGYENPPPDRNLRYSHWNYPVIYALAAALEFLAEISPEVIYRRVAALGGRLADGVGRLGYTVAAAPGPRAGIVSFDPHVRDAEALVTDLAERGIDVAARGGLLRVSPHFYNTASDIDRFLGTLEELVPRR
jgi:cysteine desulfurase / selenocysteine lyase